MGNCEGCRGVRPKVYPNTSKLKIQIKKFKLQVEALKNKQIQEGINRENLLVQKFKQEVRLRNKIGEDTDIQLIAQGINRIEVCELLINEVEKILAYINTLGQEETKKNLYPSFSFILYCEQIFNNKDLSQICKKIKQFDGNIEQTQESEIQNDFVIVAKKNRQPTLKMCNQYILRLCNEKKLSLEQINAVGHQYHFGL